MFENKLWGKVPEHLQGGLRRYVENNIEPGGFLTAVLTNDLREAIARADHISSLAIPDIVAWLWNYAPASCWGSNVKFNTWLGAVNDST